MYPLAPTIYLTRVRLAPEPELRPRTHFLFASQLAAATLYTEILAAIQLCAHQTPVESPSRRQSCLCLLCTHILVYLGHQHLHGLQQQAVLFRSAGMVEVDVALVLVRVLMPLRAPAANCPPAVGKMKLLKSTAQLSTWNLQLHTSNALPPTLTSPPGTRLRGE